jgi:hypothetical protein
MRQHIFARVANVTALLLLIAGATSCDGGQALATANAARTRYVVFLDCSTSLGKDQRLLWTEAAQRLVFQRILPGDAVTMFEVSEQTAERAPIQDVAVPLLDESSGMEETLGVRRTVASLRKEGLTAITKALQNPTAKETRLLDSLDRIPRDSSRKTFVLYLTDALESSPELDLENTKLTDRNIAALVQAAIQHHRWQQSTLSGVTIQFVLDSPAPEKLRVLNDHRALERFWRLLLTNVGADLKAFDSRVGD